MSRHLATARTRGTRSEARTLRRAERGRYLRLFGVLLVTALVVALAGVRLTTAAFTDTATLSLGASGVGSTHPFGLVLVDAAGTAHSSAPGDPLPLDLPGADALVPGRTVETTVKVANDHPSISSSLVATLAATAVPETPDITPFLRITILDEAGRVLLGGDTARPEDGAAPGTPVAAGVLAARGAPPVGDGSTWTDGAAGSAHTFTVLVHLLDDPATSTLNGGQAHLTARLDATSTEVTS